MGESLTRKDAALNRELVFCQVNPMFMGRFSRIHMVDSRLTSEGQTDDTGRRRFLQPH